jgi:hypothetical protein
MYFAEQYTSFFEGVRYVCRVFMFALEKVSDIKIGSVMS